MKIKKEEIPVTMQGPGTIMRGLSGWGGMTVAYNELPAGTDFTPLFKGLQNDSCQCPHWGYVVEGRIRMKYDNHTEETLDAGDVFYMPPGHTAMVEKDLKLLDFSPQEELQEVLEHVAKKIAEFRE
jgi:hypothetical protein